MFRWAGGKLNLMLLEGFTPFAAWSSNTEAFMNGRIFAIVGIVAVAGSTARGDIITGTITADNHYALYSSAGNVFSYHGGNELGPEGSTGGSNWSVAESYQFTAGDYMYIAAWSDDSVAQGVLGEFNSPAIGTLVSGDIRWQVTTTGVHRGDGDSHPGAQEIADDVAFANSNSTWETPFVGGNNGMQPWGTIDGISDSAQWMWRNNPSSQNALIGSNGAENMMIFRAAVPEPASFALYGLAGLAVCRRRGTR